MVIVSTLCRRRARVRDNVRQEEAEEGKDRDNNHACASAKAGVDITVSGAQSLTIKGTKVTCQLGSTSSTFLRSSSRLPGPRPERGAATLPSTPWTPGEHDL